MENNIVVKNVCKNYKEFKLDNVSFDVPAGTIVGLIGENGAGKTTIIKSILGITNADSGEIYILGNKPDEIASKEEVGIVLDETNFYETLSGDDVNKIMKNIYKSWNEDCFYKKLERFNVSSKKKIKEYSKGMRMKLGLAVALAHNPRVLVMDEALNGLDPIARTEMLDLFMEFIMNEKNSILISSHITSDLEKICDYIIFINEGKVILNDSKDSLIENYGVLKCSKEVFDSIDKSDIFSYRTTNYSCEALVKNKRLPIYKDVVVDKASLEDIMLFAIKGDKL